MKTTLLSIFTALIMLVSCNTTNVKKVEVKKTDDGFQLIRDGKPYYINGVGGKGRYALLSEYGGNSIRTWGIADWDKAFEQAEKYGLTVCAGMWLDHERQGFDYNDSTAVRKQFDRLKKGIMKYKDHPGLLMWGIGNELDLNYTNPKVWDAVEQVASFIKKVDGNHPTTTFTAFIEKEEVEYLKEKCPSIDILGVNLYAALPVLKDFLKRYEWDKPYLIGEWGTFGHWEVAQTTWGEPVEFNSSKKAEFYLNGYRDHIITDKKCLGSYAFLWGQKQERTATWYGLFLETGEKTEAVDALKFSWSGAWPENRAPKLDSLKLENKTAYQSIRVRPSEKLTAQVFTHDPENDTLTISWEIRHETIDKGVGGDEEEEPEKLTGLIKSEKGKMLEFSSPPQTGPYRLYVYVYDGNGSAAHANIPFYVEAKGDFK